MKTSSKAYPRRRWLQTLGLWGLAVGVSTKGISSLTFRQRRQIEQRLAELGKTWDEFTEELASANEQEEPSSLPEPSLQERHPEYFQGDYAQFLNNFSYRYIRTHEVMAPHFRTRNEVQNELPPANLWEHLPDTLTVADEIRHRLGTPLSYITSAYRSPAYNRECGGASRSFHTRNNALDLVYEEGSEAAFEVALQLRKEGFFQGGLGYYSGFIHIDTRGHEATWEA